MQGMSAHPLVQYKPEKGLQEVLCNMNGNRRSLEEMATRIKISLTKVTSAHYCICLWVTFGGHGSMGCRLSHNWTFSPGFIYQGVYCVTTFEQILAILWLSLNFVRVSMGCQMCHNRKKYSVFKSRHSFINLHFGFINLHSWFINQECRYYTSMLDLNTEYFSLLWHIWHPIDKNATKVKLCQNSSFCTIITLLTCTRS